MAKRKKKKKKTAFVPRSMFVRTLVGASLIPLCAASCTADDTTDAADGTATDAASERSPYDCYRGGCVADVGFGVADAAFSVAADAFAVADAAFGNDGSADADGEVEGG